MPGACACGAQQDAQAIAYINGKLHKLPQGRAEVTLLTYLRGALGQLTLESAEPVCIWQSIWQHNILCLSVNYRHQAYYALNALLNIYALSTKHE